jgi:CxxC motif-containing protein
MIEIMKLINQVELQAPVSVGDLVIENVLDTGVNVVACKNMERIG